MRNQKGRRGWLVEEADGYDWGGLEWVLKVEARSS